SLRCEAGDFSLLCRQIAAGALDAPPRRHTCGEQLTVSARREALGAHRAEQLKRSPEVPARVDSATFTAQPLTVEEMCTRQVDTESGSTKRVDRAKVEAFGLRSAVHESS